MEGLSGGSQGIGVYGQGQAGVVGTSGSGRGVQATSNSGTALYGVSQMQTAVFGFSGSGSPPFAPIKVGVFGNAQQDSSAIGVYGKTTVGKGVLAEATTGVALAITGRVTSNRSGRASIAPNKSYVDVTVAGGLTSSAFVVATLATSRSGVYVRAVRTNYPSTGKARIYLNKVASTSASTIVGWIAIG